MEKCSSILECIEYDHGMLSLDILKPSWNVTLEWAMRVPLQSPQRTAGLVRGYSHFGNAIFSGSHLFPFPLTVEQASG